ncbi:hypothetical protein EXIGLDRAFT_415091 [Exidia glandulosa HHB12029]|uniref:Uncharacterized protein n=1 Tax=Exidia glandulosa HHB12029 TaxID=1314781 RepID=A0A165PR72_EXIGL|nr:hypothetical protein EXIGLDRAFT_415091 [Exidia glandulosa HHB12029]
MAAALPPSLSPHICVLASPDLVAALNDASLPPLHNLLQSFSPLQQVTTRTTSLQTVGLASFALRFSDLLEVEAACKEDEDSRAGRAIDWIGARIAKKAATWLGDDPSGPRPKGNRTPWWDELRRCTEGDHAPSRTEGWNHPAAVVLAVSTSAPNPLAAITALHSRPSDLPQWVDPNMLRYTLIVHTPNSPLNDEECAALFNATKRQYGLHAHFLTLGLGQPATPVPLFTLPPRLPPNAAPGLPDIPEVHELRMSPEDLQQAGRFVREFVVQSLIPWMERCVLDWNENFSANRRLPTRIFSSTRRFFGSSTGSISSASAVTSPTTPNGQQLPPPSAPPQQRRLAEFATILGDFRLAIPVWEAWRKEGRGGSEVLPLMLAPSPAVGAHVAYALQPFQMSELTAQAQYRALLFAVRWEAGVQDFHSQGGDRWLSWAAGYAEEPYAAVLLAHAALIAARQGGLRRASMWYADAALRMEKSGIKPLAIFFLRQADDLLRIKPPRMLSESFQPVAGPDIRGFPALGLRVEHSLARLLYATGDIDASIRLFATLFRPYTAATVTHLHEDGVGHAQGIIDDFRVAFEHIHSTGAAADLLPALQPSISFAVPKATALRFERSSLPGESSHEQWAQLEDIWAPFAKLHTLGRLGKRSQVDVDENFWIDVALQNPLTVEVFLTNVTVIVEQHTEDGKPPTVEVIDEIRLAPRENRTVSLRLTAHHPSSLRVMRLNYSFLSLLPMSESLARRGRRLHDTPAQRQNPTYAPDVFLSVDVGGDLPRLDVAWGDRDEWHILANGELREGKLHLFNHGTKDISEVWVTRSAECPVISVGHVKLTDDPDVFSSTNVLNSPEPVRISLDTLHTSSVLGPGESCELPAVVVAGDLGYQDICLLVTYRENADGAFCSARVHRSFVIKPVMDARLVARPQPSGNGAYLVTLEIESLTSDTLQIAQLTAVSPSWSSALLAGDVTVAQSVDASQTARIALDVQPWSDGKGGAETFAHVAESLSDVVHGQPPPTKLPPALDVKCSRLYQSPSRQQLQSVQCVAEAVRRRTSTRLTAVRYSSIPREKYPFLFPLYHPRALDIVIHWSLPAEQRTGMLVLSNQLTLGASHGALDAILESAANVKAKRTMYAETVRAQLDIVNAIRNSEWNAEMNPLVVTVASSSAAHDFSKGACTLPVEFSIRNYSATNPAKFVLRLFNASQQASSGHKAAMFVGQLAYRGVVQPYQHAVVSAKVWLPHQGKYSASSWRLETEVGTAESAGSWTPVARFLSTADRDTIVEVNAA